MSTERDELARIIASSHTNAAVDAILAAGYRKPQQVGEQYVLEISAEGYPRNVGPFRTRAAAEAWMEGRKLTGSWNVYPVTSPRLCCMVRGAE